jgi:hypothetical protein
MFHRTAFLAASLLLALGGCAAIDPGAPAGGAAPLVAGWQDHSRPLIHFGPGPRPGTTVWYVPTTMPRGSYQLISRDGNTARLVDGYTFDVDASPAKEVRLILPLGVNGVEAVDTRWVAAAAPARPTP